jgi:ATP-dependent Lon protease
MPESVREIIQQEIDQLDGKSEYDTGKRVTFLNHVFRLPWDDRVDPFWDLQHAKEELDKTHFGMSETKERILEFIAKNKRINS